MLIKEWMSKPVITINHNESLNDAAKLFRTRVISMIPVLMNDLPAGIITDGDLKKALPSDATTLDRFELL
ncbi:MAG: CBS domain-containing protein, partial [Desulfotignum sp.]